MPRAESGPLARLRDSDLWHSFWSSRLTVAAAVVTAAIVLAATFAAQVAPTNPYALEQLSLIDAFTPPAWLADDGRRFLLGTDDQGRDVLSVIIFGARVSLFVGFASVTFSMVIGISLGLISGYVGGTLDAFIMRVADIQLSFPAILVALLVDGVVRSTVPGQAHGDLAIWVLVFSIGITNWVQFARTVRGSTMVERNKEYVQAAHVTGVRPAVVMLRHVLPNVIGPVLVIATVGLAVAVLLEATLSFLGVGMPPTRPSLGTLVNTGQNFMASGEWWIALFPGLALAILVLSVNLLGDWLRDALNPKLR